MSLNIFDELQETESEPWGGYDFSKPSLVAVAYNGQTGAVLWGVGGHILMEIEEAGLSHLDDLGLEPPEAGIWIWEGKYIWSSGGFEHPEDGEMLPKGEWRQPTDEEWQAMREGSCPWNDEDWELK